MNANKLSSRVFGIFFILAFIAYGTGNGIIQSLINSTANMTDIYNHRVQIVIGGILMASCHTFFNMWLAVIMFRVLRNHNGFMAYGYLSFAVMATTMLIVGAVFLILLAPLSEVFVQEGAFKDISFESLIVLSSKINFFCYQFAMIVWGFGGLVLCYLLYGSGVVPRLFPVWGYAGYSIFIIGTFLEVFGYPVGLYLSLPGGLFEIVLSVWLISKGFNREAWQRLNPVPVL